MSRPVGRPRKSTVSVRPNAFAQFEKDVLKFFKSPGVRQRALEKIAQEILREFTEIHSSGLYKPHVQFHGAIVDGVINVIVGELDPDAKKIAEAWDTQPVREVKS